jgi:hypothetical protein
MQWADHLGLGVDQIEERAVPQPDLPVVSR